MHRYHVLAKLIGTAKVGAGEKAKTTTVYLQWLMDGKFHREISYTFGITLIDSVRDLKIRKTHDVFILHEGAR